MTELVPASEIEQLVGARRHRTRHFARAVSKEQMVYILHSEGCRDSGRDLRECWFSMALDKGIREADWVDHMDQPVRVTIDLTGEHLLIPVAPVGEAWEL